MCFSVLLPRMSVSSIMCMSGVRGMASGDVGLWATMGLCEIEPVSSDYCFLLTIGTALQAFTFKYKTQYQ